MVEGLEVVVSWAGLAGLVGWSAGLGGGGLTIELID